MLSLQDLEPKSMHNTLPVIWDRAVNDIVTSEDGKEYIDFTSTIFVMNVGHANPLVSQSIVDATQDHLLHTYTFPHRYREIFLRKLIETTPTYLEKAFLLSSGTEATEAAVKMMRMYTGRKKIFSFKDSMHGRTMAAELMKGSGFYQHEDFVQIPLPNRDSIFEEDFYRQVIDEEDLAGFMIETYQGWSGRFFHKEYIQDLCQFAKDNGILVCFDEIQAGFYRTGKLFGYEHYGVEPDLVCIGKAIGGGLPLSGVLGRKEILDMPDVGEMSSTHSGNPLCCASGYAVLKELERIKEDLHEKVTILRKGMREIAKKDMVKECNVKGMMAALVFQDEQTATDIAYECMYHGLLVVYTGRESIKVGPPLTITHENLEKGLAILEKGIDYRN